MALDAYAHLLCVSFVVSPIISLFVPSIDLCPLALFVPSSNPAPSPLSSHHHILPPRLFGFAKGRGVPQAGRRGEGSASARQLVTFQAFMRIDTLSEPTSHRVV